MDYNLLGGGKRKIIFVEAEVLLLAWCKKKINNAGCNCRSAEVCDGKLKKLNPDSLFGV